MTIYKGQLMNQETKDILYPQTSTDMVDGLEELLEQAVIDNMTPPQNLLVNGDFQINQRGQSEYIHNGYTLDMWKAYKSNSTTMSVKQVENGVELYADKIIGLSQGVSYKNALSKIFTLVVSLDDTVYSFVSTIQTTPTDYDILPNINLSTEYIEESNIINVGIWLKDGVKHTVNYINLFEGDIAYPHVVEDKAIALMRCQRKIIRLKKIIFAKISGVTFVGGFLFPVELDSFPSVVLNSIKESATERPLEGYDAIEYNTQGVNYVDVAEQQTTQSFVTLDITFSCEPL